ncbi:MAG: bifunctional hydroxymethylpyrimidine kinase/phosphomethylpyrimidine kinase [Myxococcales bacterium]|nr:bifunctional hydroxymethylpyrimidine kinase/phosphomethylpyrimidine kinase [Myxococcales bacterium]
MSLWLVGGLDPTGGAGVGRDRATALAVAPTLEVVTVISAMTQQGDGRPARAVPTAPTTLRAALAGIGTARAVKLGLVPAACVEVVAAALRPLRVPRVLDPVLRATDGGDLGADVEGTHLLAACVDLLTPNRAEARALLGELPAQEDALVTAVRERGLPSVLFKDAEDPDPAWVCDRLVHDGRCVDFRRPRVQGADPRGTGCALATAIACGLAQGRGVVEACASAIAWLDVARTRTHLGPDGRPHLSE